MKLPQLSLRELFLLVVIAAMGCGWWVDRQSLVASYKALREFYETPIEPETILVPDDFIMPNGSTQFSDIDTATRQSDTESVPVIQIEEPQIQ